MKNMVKIKTRYACTATPYKRKDECKYFQQDPEYAKVEKCIHLSYFSCIGQVEINCKCKKAIRDAIKNENIHQKFSVPQEDNS